MPYGLRPGHPPFSGNGLPSARNSTGPGPLLRNTPIPSTLEEDHELPVHVSPWCSSPRGVRGCFMRPRTMGFVPSCPPASIAPASPATACNPLPARRISRQSTKKCSRSSELPKAPDRANLSERPPKRVADAGSARDPETGRYQLNVGSSRGERSWSGRPGYRARRGGADAWGRPFIRSQARNGA